MMLTAISAEVAVRMLNGSNHRLLRYLLICPPASRVALVLLAGPYKAVRVISDVSAAYTS
jgi:hypothetical protein